MHSNISSVFPSLNIFLCHSYTRVRHRACVDNSALAQETRTADLPANSRGTVQSGLSPYSDYTYSIQVEYIKRSDGNTTLSDPVDGTFQTTESGKWLCSLYRQHSNLPLLFTLWLVIFLVERLFCLKTALICYRNSRSGSEMRVNKEQRINFKMF